MRCVVAILVSGLFFSVVSISFATTNHSVDTMVLASNKAKSVNHPKNKRLSPFPNSSYRFNKYFGAEDGYISMARFKADGDGVNYNLTDHLAMRMNMISITNPNNTVPAVHGGLAGLSLKF